MSDDLLDGSDRPGVGNAKAPSGMKPRTPSRLPAFIAASCGTAVLIAFGITVALAVISPEVRETGAGGAVWSFPFVAMALIGALLIWRRSTNATGWVLAGAGLVMSLDAVAQDYTLFAYSTSPPRLGAATVSWFGFWLWIPAAQMMGLFFLLFPTGWAISRAWRPVIWGAVAIVVASAVAAVPTWGSRGPHLLDAPTPAAVPGGDLLSLLANAGFPAVMLAGISSLVVRYRRGGSLERHQIKWLLFAAGLMVGALALGFVVGTIKGIDDPISDPIVAFGTLLASSSVPVAAGIAILRHRLYDIDLVINKTVVYGALAAFITAAYLGLVIGIGAVVGGRTILSIIATAVIAVAFQPVRQRVQAFANRLVYGQRVTPYEAMADLSHQMAGAISLDEVLPRLAKTAAEGVGAARSRVRVFLPDGEERAAWWPEDQALDSFDRSVRVIHQQEEVGEIAVAKSPGESLSNSEEKLLSDLASQAGLALRNVRLTEDLRASRRRIVTAQDEERRRMERDIHDGAQQQLVSMSVKLGLLGSMVKDLDRASALAEEIKAEAGEAVETVRDLARGLFPQILVDSGIGRAVQAYIAKMQIPAAIEDRLGRARFDLEVEANVYFCIREAVQNASKHAPGSPISVELSAEEGFITFQIADEGPGFDLSKIRLGSGLHNMKDRIEALGGSFEIESASGAGTSIRGRVPAQGAGRVQ